MDLTLNLEEDSAQGNERDATQSLDSYRPIPKELFRSEIPRAQRVDRAKYEEALAQLPDVEPEEHDRL